MKFIDYWNRFDQEAISKHERSPGERENLRRAFYLGGMGMLALLERMSQADGGIDLDAVHDELDQFWKGVKDEHHESEPATGRKKF